MKKYFSLKIKMIAIRTIMEIDTTVKPITQPALKAVLKALPKENLA